MADENGEVVGFFIALLVLVAAIPSILVVIGWLRWKYSYDTFDKFLAREAKHSVEEGRADIFNFINQEREENSSFSSSKLSRSAKELAGLVKSSSATYIDDSELYPIIKEKKNPVEHYQRALREGYAHYGIKDFYAKKGILTCTCFGACKETPFTKTLPIGLFEDFLFYICNNVDPLPLAFGDKLHPEGTFAKYVSFTLSKAFALFIYFYTGGATSVTILLTPVVLIFDIAFRYLLVCPCLQDKDSEDETKDLTEEESQRRPTTCCCSTTKDKKWLVLQICLRTIGVFLAFPFLLAMITLLVLTSIVLTKVDSTTKLALAKFIWFGIIFPFLLKLAFSAFLFAYFIYPFHVNICGFNVLNTNRWIEDQIEDKRVKKSLLLSKEERLQRQEVRRDKMYGIGDLYVFNCRCFAFRGLPDDSHNTLEICRPYCLCKPGIDRMKSLFFEETSVQRRALYEVIQEGNLSRQHQEEIVITTEPQQNPNVQVSKHEERV